MTEAVAPAPTPSQAGSFPVELPVFTGPFRLLADLILEQKVDVCDVRIADVTDGYLARSRRMPRRWNLEEATWFLAICAVLLELKVARLTPKHTEPRRGGPARAVRPTSCMPARWSCAAFRKVAVELARRLEDEAGYFARDVGPGPEFSHLYPDPMGLAPARRPRRGRRPAAAPAADAGSLACHARCGSRWPTR